MKIFYLYPLCFLSFPKQEYLWAALNYQNLNRRLALVPKCRSLFVVGRVLTCAVTATDTPSAQMNKTLDSLRNTLSSHRGGVNLLFQCGFLESPLRGSTSFCDRPPTVAIVQSGFECTQSPLQARPEDVQTDYKEI